MYYVIEGTLLETTKKEGEIHLEGQSVLHKVGSIVGIQYLLKGYERSFSMLINNTKDHIRVVRIDVYRLTELLLLDDEKELALWKLVVQRVIVMNPHMFPLLSKWKSHHVNKLAHLSFIKIYQPKEAVNLLNGGIILAGKLKNVKPSYQGGHNKFFTMDTLRRF
mmetsp:Transcript_23515/g.23183  ORF Transcript_23515/g.23183 Transcript_23515/m.23183 type:complete len:164 (-) Transcript_23515:782-1273(-)